MTANKDAHVWISFPQPLLWRTTGGPVKHAGANGDPVVAANAELHRMFGYELDTLICKSVEMLLPEALRSMHIGLRTGFFDHPELSH